MKDEDKSRQRYKKLTSELQRILYIITHQYQPLKVYLFGSLAGEDIQEWSDLDVVVIKQTQKSFYERSAEIIRLVKPQCGFDVIVYTPKEWEMMSTQRAFIINEVMGKGKLLYAA